MPHEDRPISPLIPNVKAAAYLGIERQTLDTWRCSRRQNIPYVRIGRKVMYRVADLDAFIASRTVGATEPAVGR